MLFHKNEYYDIYLICETAIGVKGNSDDEAELLLSTQNSRDMNNPT